MMKLELRGEQLDLSSDVGRLAMSRPARIRVEAMIDEWDEPYLEIWFESEDGVRYTRMEDTILEVSWSTE